MGMKCKMIDIKRYPLLLLAFFWLIGLLVGSILFKYEILIAFCFVIGILLLIISFISFNHKSNKWFIWLIISVFLFAFARMELYEVTHQSVITTELVEQLQDDEIGIRGYIDTRLDINGDLVKFMVKPISYYYDNKEFPIVTKERLLIHLYLKDIEDLSIVNAWESGMGISFTGSFGDINITSNPGQFNYEKYLQREAVYWKIIVSGINSVKVSDASAVNNGINSIRDSFTNTLDSLFDQSQSGFLKSILLGDSSDIPSDLQDNFSITGLSHLLAISGLHFSIITFIIFAILLKLRVTKENAAIIVSIVLLFYMILIGLRPSVVRATIMTLIMLYGFVFKNRISALQALGVAFIIMTLYNPMWIFNIGFQLSFIITFYILWGYPEVYYRLPLKDGLLKKSLSLVIITQFASFPIIFYYFHQYSLISWLANLLIVPFFSSIILPFGLFILVFGSFNLQIVGFFAEIMSFILTVLFKIIDWIADLSFFHFYGNVNSVIVILIIYISFTWLLMRRRIKESFITFNIEKYLFILEKAVIVLLVIIILVPLITDNDVEITFIDVGQGDSIYIKTLNGKNILIDSGGNFIYPKEEWKIRDNPFEVGKDIVLPYLRYIGVKNIDFAILTHEDFDHIGGYFSIIDEVNIGTFIAEKGFPRTDNGEKLYDKLVEKNISIITVEEAKGITLDKSTEMFFIPADIASSDKENDHSFAILLNIYNTRVLLSGDIEKVGELSILEKYRIEPIDILKVGHHGSNTSSSEKWLEELQPTDAIISVGKNNRYNLPADEVLLRLEDFESNIWRTDDDGAILLRVFPDRYEVNKNVNNN